MTEILLTWTLRLKKSIKSTKFIQIMPLWQKIAPPLEGQMFYIGLYKGNILADEATRLIAWIFGMKHYPVDLYQTIQVIP